MTKIELKQMYFQMFTLPNFTFYFIFGNYIIYRRHSSYKKSCSCGENIQHSTKKSHDFDFCAAELTV